VSRDCKGMNPLIGDSFEAFLKEDGRYESVQTKAIKRVLAMQLEEAMRQRNVSKVEMARRMTTSRVRVDRLLDPANDSVKARNPASRGRYPGTRGTTRACLIRRSEPRSAPTARLRSRRP
jgi:antitoxin HicB